MVLVLEGNEKLCSTCVRLLKGLYTLGRKQARMVCKKARAQFRKDKCKVQCWGVITSAVLGWNMSNKVVALPGST